MGVWVGGTDAWRGAGQHCRLGGGTLVKYQRRSGRPCCDGGSSPIQIPHVEAPRTTQIALEEEIVLLKATRDQLEADKVGEVGFGPC